MKGVGRIDQQTFIDTYSKVGFAKLYDVKTAITAAELLNDRVIPFFDQHEIPLCRVLTDRGTEFCGNPERHEYELYLAVEDIDHSRTKTKSPQTNGICERFRKIILQEFYRVASARRSIAASPTAGRSRRMDGAIQRGPDTPGAMVLWQDADAHLPRRPASGQGEADRGIVSIGQTQGSRQPGPKHQTVRSSLSFYR